MKFITIPQLKPGMIIAQSIYDQNNLLMLTKGTILTDKIIQRLQVNGYKAVYISDGKVAVENVQQDVIENEVRNSAIRYIKDMFTVCKEGKLNNIDVRVKLKQGRILVRRIVAEIVGKDIMAVHIRRLLRFDHFTYHHSVNVCILSIILGKGYGLNTAQLIEVGIGALLHDIGKTFIDQNLLFKAGRLTSEELASVKGHAEKGYVYMDGFEGIAPSVLECARYHHEKYDGTGYPTGKKGEEIPLYARIVALCDVYEALVSNRPYKEPALPSNAMEYIMASSGSHFDPALVECFVKEVSIYPVGTLLELSNGYRGKVVRNLKSFGLRPRVRVIADEKDRPMDQIWELKNLMKYRNITITRVITE